MKTILVDAINTFVIKNEGIFADMYKMLEEYPNRKIILTNANDAQMVQFGLVEMPYEVFTLKHEPDKVDSGYYSSMLAHFGLDVSDVVYFEHSADAVRSARSLGICVFHYDDVLRDLGALRGFFDGNLQGIYAVFILTWMSF